MRTATFLVALLAGLGAVAAPATAEAGAPLFAPPGKVEWKRGWDRFTPAEGGFTLGLTVGAYIVDKKLPDYPEPKSDFEVPLLDPGARWLFRGRTAQVQETFAGWSDIGFRVLVLFPYVVDAGIVAAGAHRNVDVAAQLFMIDLQSLTLAGISQLVTSRLTSRTRPYVQDCKTSGGRYTSGTCGPTSDHRSFYGGHTSAAFTSAALTCLHHQNIPLYGGGAPDAWACIWSLAMASTVMASRLVADEHWASDNLIGVGTGFVYGYLLPKWLHYGWNGARPKSLLLGAAMRWAPSFNPVHDGGVLGLSTRF